MKHVTINIAIEENQLKQAIAEGWNERFSDHIDASEINSLDNIEDIAHAMTFIDIECITSVRVR